MANVLVYIQVYIDVYVRVSLGDYNLDNLGTFYARNLKFVILLTQT